MTSPAPTQGIDVRLATSADLVAAGEVTLAGYRADGFLDGPDGVEDGYAERLLDTADRAANAELVVALDGDEVLGTVTWCPPASPYRELSTDDGQGEFRMLAVSPQARRRGVGRALVRWCLDHARAQGLREVLICSLPQMTSAHAMYADLGFVRALDLDWSPVPGVELWGFRLPLVPA